MIQVNPIIFLGNTCKHNRKTLQMGKYNNLYREKAARNIEVPYYSVSLQCLQIFSKRLQGSPKIFTTLPITIKDFPCNSIVVSLCIVFPYHFYKYGMGHSLHSTSEGKDYLPWWCLYCVSPLVVQNYSILTADAHLCHQRGR